MNEREGRKEGNNQHIAPYVAAHEMASRSLKEPMIPKCRNSVHSENLTQKDTQRTMKTGLDM